MFIATLPGTNYSLIIYIFGSQIMKVDKQDTPTGNNPHTIKKDAGLIIYINPNIESLPFIQTRKYLMYVYTCVCTYCLDHIPITINVAFSDFNNISSPLST